MQHSIKQIYVNKRKRSRPFCQVLTVDSPFKMNGGQKGKPSVDKVKRLLRAGQLDSIELTWSPLLLWLDGMNQILQHLYWDATMMLDSLQVLGSCPFTDTCQRF